ncbi:sulfurtransferase complex subunit TusC [Thalassotalea piscium]
MTAITKTIAILNTKAPFARATAKEALDVALIFGSYEQATSLFFQGDGVYQLMDKQQPEHINCKDFLKTFAAFEFYDLENIYVCQQSLNERKLSHDFHIDNVNILSVDDFSSRLRQHSVILTF